MELVPDRRTFIISSNSFLIICHPGCHGWCEIVPSHKILKYFMLKMSLCRLKAFIVWWRFLGKWIWFFYESNAREKQRKKKAILPNVFFLAGNVDESPLLLGAENTNACQCFEIVSDLWWIRQQIKSSDSDLAEQYCCYSNESIEDEFYNRLRQILWTKKKSHEKLKSIDVKNDDELIRKMKEKNEFDVKREKESAPKREAEPIVRRTAENENKFLSIKLYKHQKTWQKKEIKLLKHKQKFFFHHFPLVVNFWCAKTSIFVNCYLETMRKSFIKNIRQYKRQCVEWRGIVCRCASMIITHAW